MDIVYAQTPRLLLAAAPDVFANDIFAMKGGGEQSFRSGHAAPFHYHRCCLISVYSNSRFHQLTTSEATPDLAPLLSQAISHNKPKLLYRSVDVCDLDLPAFKWATNPLRDEGVHFGSVCLIVDLFTIEK